MIYTYLFEILRYAQNDTNMRAIQVLRNSAHGGGSDCHQITYNYFLPKFTLNAHGSGIAININNAPENAMFLKNRENCPALAAASSKDQKSCIIIATITKNAINKALPILGYIPVIMLTPPASSIRPVIITANSGKGTPFDAV